MTPFVTTRRALSDEHLLGGALGGDSWLAWRVLLIAAMGEALTDAERAIFAKLTGREREPGERVDELWCVIGRRDGKSRAIAALLVYLATMADYRVQLVSGERGVVLCLARTQEQSQVVLEYVAGVILRRGVIGLRAELFAQEAGSRKPCRLRSCRLPSQRCRATLWFGSTPGGPASNLCRGRNSPAARTAWPRSNWPRQSPPRPGRLSGSPATAD